MLGWMKDLVVLLAARILRVKEVYGGELPFHSSHQVSYSLNRSGTARSYPIVQTVLGNICDAQLRSPYEISTTASISVEDLDGLLRASWGCCKLVRSLRIAGCFFPRPTMVGRSNFPLYGLSMPCGIHQLVAFVGTRIVVVCCTPGLFDRRNLHLV